MKDAAGGVGSFDVGGGDSGALHLSHRQESASCQDREDPLTWRERQESCEIGFGKRFEH